MFGLANPDRFMRFTGPIVPVLWVLALVGLVAGTAFSFAAPQDYQQGDTVRIMFIHIPAAIWGLGAYGALGVSSFFALVFRHALADAAARAAALPGAGLTALALITGSLWGKPMWGTWWVWDARLTSMLILLFLYFGVIALGNAISNRDSAAKACAVLALVGVVNIPIIKYSVDWWNSLHQTATFTVTKKPAMPVEMWLPLLLGVVGFYCFFGALLLYRMRLEVLRREGRTSWVKAEVEKLVGGRP